MPRTLNTATLDGMAKHLASEFLRGNIRSKSVEGLYIGGPEFVLQQLYRYDFKDEFDYLLGAIRERMGPATLKDFNDAAAQRFSPRDEDEHAGLLADKLAIDPDGNHIAGKIGSVIVGTRLLGQTVIEVEHPASVRARRIRGLGKVHRITHRKIAPWYWPVYAGEEEERAAGSDAVDALPFEPMMALNFRIANADAIDGLDTIVDKVDGGTAPGIVTGRSGAQPADVDTTATGTVLFTCIGADPFFGAAADDTPGAIATAGTISDDTSADATDTLGYCRVSTADTGAPTTPVSDRMDLEAGTSGADINFNTLSIVSGGTVSITSFTVRLPEGAGL